MPKTVGRISLERGQIDARAFPKGAGSIFTFNVKGGEGAAMAFCNHLRIFSLLANVAE